MEAIDILRAHLHAMATVCDSMPCREPARFKSIEAFVLAYGKVYRPLEKLPAGFRKGKPRECFVNSATLSLTRDLIYVEGYAVTKDIGLPIYHAWVTEPGSDAAIDVTTDAFDAYIGVAFTPDDLQALWNLPTTYACVLDDPKNKHPFLFMTDEQVREILYDGGPVQA